MPDWVQVGIFTLTLVFMLVGLFGLIVPIFPGVFIIWLAALFYGIVTGFPPLGIAMFVLITIGMIAGGIVDNIMMGVGARKGGGSWWAIILGLVAGVAGTIFFPPFGGIIAAPLAVLFVEYIRARDLKQAWRATSGLAIGWGLSFFLRFGIGVLMVGCWLIWALVK